MVLRRGWAVVTALAVIVLGSFAISVSADTTVPRGAVVVLQGTPHLWIGDDDGVLHWAGDTRALAGRYVEWGNRREVSLTDLAQFRRGAPWLSSGLLKSGDPIYLVKWESAEAVPTLLQIQTIKDVELFGITGGNYGEFVMEPASWEKRYGLGTTGLTRGQMAPANGTPVPTAVPTPAGFSEALRLNRNPILRPDGDLTFVAPTAWVEGFDIPDARDANVDLMYSSQRLGAWTTTDAPSQVYALVGASNLDFNKEVKTTEDLVKKALANYCRGAVTCTGTDITSGRVTTFAGQPAFRLTTRSRIEYYTTDNPPVQRVHEWTAVHYFFVRGNWGYEFRVFGEDPTKFEARSQTTIDALNTIRFRS